MDFLVRWKTLELNLEHGSHKRVYICEYVYVCSNKLCQKYTSGTNFKSIYINNMSPYSYAWRPREEK